MGMSWKSFPGMYGVSSFLASSSVSVTLRAATASSKWLAFSAPTSGAATVLLRRSHASEISAALTLKRNLESVWRATCTKPRVIPGKSILLILELFTDCTLGWKRRYHSAKNAFSSASLSPPSEAAISF